MATKNPKGSVTLHLGQRHTRVERIKPKQSIETHTNQHEHDRKKHRRQGRSLWLRLKPNLLDR